MSETPESTPPSERVCPLAVAGILSHQPGLLNEPLGKKESICRKHQCSWWVAGPRKPTGDCVLVEIVESLWRIATPT